jgi:hypothetical protein
LGRIIFFGRGPNQADACGQRAEYEPQAGETAHYQFNEVTSMIHKKAVALAILFFWFHIPFSHRVTISCEFSRLSRSCITSGSTLSDHWQII